MSIELAPTISGAPVRRWKRYSAYRDSGVEWLGEVPGEWITWKITHGFQQVGSGTTPKSDDMQYYNGEIPWVTTSELRETVITDTKSKLTEKALKDYSSLHIYPPDTLLFAMYGATIGRMGLLEIHATVNQACCAFTDSKFLDPKFTFYWLWMRRPILITLSVGGGQPNLSQDDLRNIRIPVPSLPDQRAIAAFLNRETGRIDTLIEKKERQIELLQEKRAALISHVVTKGLYPDVSMKDSGVEWLGEVAEGWEVVELRRLLDSVNGIKIGPFGSQLKSDIIQPTGFKVYGQENVIARNFDLGYRFVDEDKFKELAVCEIVSGDIVVTMMGTTGRCQVVPEDIQKGIMDSHLLRIRINEMTINPIFLEILIDEALYIKHQIKVGGKGSIMHGLNSSIIKSLSIVLPSLPEQCAIAAFLDHETGRIDALEKKVRESIEKLREYRTAFISAAVTGKIDVRKEESHEQC
jgi:type I restriction enzyme, S subunit